MKEGSKSMSMLTVVPNRSMGSRGYNLGQYHHAAHHGAATVTATDITNELARRGYVARSAPPVPALTKSMAVAIAVDEGLKAYNLPHTAAHLYRCPTGTCTLNMDTWDRLVQWCVTVANGYLSKVYAIPAWAQSMITHGTLRGLNGLGHLGGWVQDHAMEISLAGEIFASFGQYLTAKEVSEGIKEIEKSTGDAMKASDIPALIAALQAQGAIAPGQEHVVAEGAQAAVTPGWMMPAMILGGGALLFLLMKR